MASVTVTRRPSQGRQPPRPMARSQNQAARRERKVSRAYIFPS